MFSASASKTVPFLTELLISGNAAHRNPCDVSACPKPGPNTTALKLAQSLLINSAASPAIPPSLSATGRYVASIKLLAIESTTFSGEAIVTNPAPALYAPSPARVIAPRY